MSDVVLEVVVTGPADWATAFVDSVVADGLIACAHQVPMQACYTWSGEVQRDPEVRAMMHTSPARRADLVARIRAEHPYDVPCILTTDMSAEPDYGDWVRDVTSG